MQGVFSGSLFESGIILSLDVKSRLTSRIHHFRPKRRDCRAAVLEMADEISLCLNVCKGFGEMMAEIRH